MKSIELFYHKCLKKRETLFLVLMILMVYGCSKQNTPSPLNVDPPPVVPDEYYDALRIYKKSDHPIMFGWVGGSGTASPAGRGNGYWDIPDSVDIVSLWGGYPPIGSQNYKDMIDVREKKGIRYVWCMFGSGVDNLRKKNFPKLDILTGIDSVAKSIADTVSYHKLDGFDLDYEPSYGDGGIFGHGTKDSGGDIYTQRLFKALSKYLGPLSGTGKLLIIDGESEKGIASYIDYLVQQAYGASTASNLQSRFNQYGFGTLPSKKFVVAETYEEYRTPGSGNLEFMAKWNPVEGRKGGVGVYHLEYDFGVNPTLPYERIRRSIQLLNPAIR